MCWITWDNQQDAEDSLSAVNTFLGCPINLENGYVMQTWAVVSKSDAQDEWGFAHTPERLCSDTDIDAVIEPGFTRYEQKPSDWTPESTI